MQYEVVQLIWHTKDERYYEPGAVVSLDHLAEDKRLLLVNNGVVKPHQPAVKVPPGEQVLAAPAATQPFTTDHLVSGQQQAEPNAESQDGEEGVG